jgi:lysophospholipase L1-like esterase
MKIICLGDSLTSGYKLRKEDTWPFIIVEETKIQVVNKGITGDTTSGMLSRFHRDVLDEKPTHIIITGGTNDIIFNIPLSIVQGNLASLVFQAYHYNITPILGVSMPLIPLRAKKNFKFSQNFEQVNEKLKENRDWIINFASLVNCKVIDFYKDFKIELMNQGKEELYKDGVHPTAEGNKRMAKAAITQLWKSPS